MAAGKTAVLAVRIISDAKDSARGFDEGVRGVDRFSAAAERARGRATVALGGIALAAKEVFDSASKLQQSSGAVESVFGANAAAVKASAAGAAQAVGLASSEYQDLAAVFGSQLKNMGVAADQLAPKTDQLIGLGADLAATYGGTTSDAVAAVSSLLRGETDPIERYGVSIKQADINARLAAMGLGDLEGEAAKAAQAQAVLGLLTDQTGSALGAFDREAGTAAGQTQRAAAEFENAKAALGEALLPVVTAVAEKLGELARWAGENATTVQILAGVIAGLAAAVLIVNGALAAYRAIAAVATAAQWLWNAAMSANPLMLIVLAIVAVVAAVVLAYQKFSWFRDLVDAVGRFFGRVFEPFVRIIRDLWTGITNAGSAWDVFKALAMAAINVILAPLRTLWNIVKEVAKGIGKVGSFVGGLFSAPEAAAAGATAATAGMYAAAAGSPASGLYGTAAGSSPVGPTSLGGSAGRGHALGGDTINIRIDGALDPDATADRVRRVLDRRDRNLGRVPGMSVGLAR